MTKTMTTPPWQQPIEVVTDRPSRPGVTAHRRKGFNVWPSCQPLHKHPCENERKYECESKCVCKCDCTDIPRWHELSALSAVSRGVTLCPNSLCFGEWL